MKALSVPMTRRFQLLFSVVLTSLVAALATTATPQAQAGAFPPASLKNLQVLPKDTPVPVVIDLMKELTRSLGVRCDHCHVGIDGQPLTSFDFVSDDKKAKTTARTMFRLVDQINTALDRTVPGQDGGRVTCITCHGGRRTPRK